MAFDPNGQPNFYFNCIVGLAAKWLDMARLETFFASYAGSTRQELFDELVWLGLENCVYEKELPVRPVLSTLRQQYAETFFAHQRSMSRQQWMAKNNQVYEQQEARWAPLAHRHGPLLTPRGRDLARALALPGTLDTDGVISSLQEILHKFFLFSGSDPVRRLHALHFKGMWAALLTKLLPTEVRHTDQLMLRQSSQLQDGAVQPAGKALMAHHLSTRRAEADRAYYYTLAMDTLQTGNMPDANTLEKAGIDSGTAGSISAYYKALLTPAASSSGGGGSSRSSGGSRSSSSGSGGSGNGGGGLVWDGGGNNNDPNATRIEELYLERYNQLINSGRTDAQARSLARNYAAYEGTTNNDTNYADKILRGLGYQV